MKNQHKKKLKKKERSLSKILSSSSSAPDLNTGQACDNIHEGWLEKRSGSKFSAKRWKKRYFVLTSNDDLLYYEDERCRSRPGVVDLVGSKVIRPEKYRLKYGEHPDSNSDAANDARRRTSSLASAASSASSTSGGDGRGGGFSSHTITFVPGATQFVSATIGSGGGSHPTSPSARSGPTGTTGVGLPPVNRRSSSGIVQPPLSPSHSAPSQAAGGRGGGSGILPRYFVLEIVNPRRSWILRSSKWEELEAWFARLTELQRSPSSKHAITVPPIDRGSSGTPSAASSGTTTPTSAHATHQTQHHHHQQQQRQLSPQIVAESSYNSSAGTNTKTIDESSRASQHSLFPVGTSSSSSVNQHTNISVSQVGSGDNEGSVSYRSSDFGESDNDSIDSAPVHSKQQHPAARRRTRMPRRSRTTPSGADIATTPITPPVTSSSSTTAATGSSSRPAHISKAKTATSPSNSTSSFRFFHRAKPAAGTPSVPPRLSEKFSSARAATATGATSRSAGRTPVSTGGPAFFDDEESKDGSSRFNAQRIDTLWAPIVDDMIEREGRSFFELIDVWDKQKADKQKAEQEEEEECDAAAAEHQAAAAETAAAVTPQKQHRQSEAVSTASNSGTSSVAAAAADAAVVAAPSAPSTHDGEQQQHSDKNPKFSMSKRPSEPFSALSVVTPSESLFAMAVKPHHTRRHAQTHALVPMLSPLTVSRTLPRSARNDPLSSNTQPLPSHSAPSSPRMKGGLPPPPKSPLWNGNNGSLLERASGLPPPPLPPPRKNATMGVTVGASLAAMDTAAAAGSASPLPPMKKPLSPVPLPKTASTKAATNGSTGGSGVSASPTRPGGRWSSRRNLKSSTAAAAAPSASRPTVKSVLAGVGERFEILLDDEYEALFDEDDRLRSEKNEAYRLQQRQQHSQRS